jgi:hypothetical protein
LALYWSFSSGVGVTFEFYITKSVFFAVNASLRWLNNGYLLIFIIHSNYKWSIIVYWLAACFALRVVGAVLAFFLRHWRKISTILLPMGSLLLPEEMF